MRYAILAVVLLFGCGDYSPAEPVPPFTVSITGLLEGSWWSAEDQRYECDYIFTARASGGEEGEYATWTSAEIDWLYTDGSSPGTTYFYASDVVDRWGSSRIAAGEVQTWDRWAHSSREFDLFFTFRLRHTSGENFSETVFVNCF